MDEVAVAVSAEDARAVDITVVYTLVATSVAERLQMTVSPPT